jgi:hypothetical protein
MDYTTLHYIRVWYQRWLDNRTICESLTVRLKEFECKKMGNKGREDASRKEALINKKEQVKGL